MAEKTVCIALECHSITEYQLLPRAFILMLDKTGVGINPMSVPHQAMEALFRSDWAKLTHEQQLSFVRRMAVTLKIGGLMEGENLNLRDMAESMTAAAELHEKQGRQN